MDVTNEMELMDHGDFDLVSKLVLNSREYIVLLESERVSDTSDHVVIEQKGKPGLRVVERETFEALLSFCESLYREEILEQKVKDLEREADTLAAALDRMVERERQAQSKVFDLQEKLSEATEASSTEVRIPFAQQMADLVHKMLAFGKPFLLFPDEVDLFIRELGKSELLQPDQLTEETARNLAVFQEAHAHIPKVVFDIWGIVNFDNNLHNAKTYHQARNTAGESPANDFLLCFKESKNHTQILGEFIQGKGSEFDSPSISGEPGFFHAFERLGCLKPGSLSRLEACRLVEVVSAQRLGFQEQLEEIIAKCPKNFARYKDAKG